MENLNDQSSYYQLISVNINDTASHNCQLEHMLMSTLILKLHSQPHTELYIQLHDCLSRFNQI